MQTEEVSALLEFVAQPHNDNNRTVHEQAKNGRVFTIDELCKLGNPHNRFGVTPAHIMARNGYPFTVDDLVRLGNPADLHGISVAHEMVHFGRNFSFSDLKKILSIPPEYDWTVAHALAKKGYIFPMRELIELLEMTALSSNSIAHVMARYGFRFTVENLIRIGNPTNAIGLTVADIMKLKGNTFTKKSDRIPGTDWKTLSFSHYSVNPDLSWVVNLLEGNAACYVCGTALSRIMIGTSAGLQIEASKFHLPHIEAGEVFMCPLCGWWVVHERLKDAFQSSPAKEFFAFADRAEKDIPVITDPWNNPLRQANVYEQASTIINFTK